MRGRCRSGHGSRTWATAWQPFDARGVGVMWGPREGQHDRTAGSVTPFGSRVLATAEAHHAGLLVLDPAAA